MPRPRPCGLLAVLALWTVPAAAQTPSVATLRGTASSSFNGHPLAGVMIAVPAARKFVVTDSSGSFWLGGLPTGLQLIRVSFDGRETDYFRFELRGEHVKRIAVLLDLEAVDLDPIVVEVRQVNGQRDLAGFYERLDVSRVAAVEVYRGEPPYGLSPSLAVSAGSSIWMGGGFPNRGNCGLVMIWTR